MSRILWLSIAFAGCTNTASHPVDTDAGVGSGSGSGIGNGSFTLDQAGFYDDGHRWWSATSGPTLTGTVKDPGALHVSIAGKQIGDAVIDGDRWTLALPDGSIAPSDTAVTAADRL